MVWRKLSTEPLELKSTRALKGDGVFESDVLGMDLSYDRKKGVAKLSLEKYTCTVSENSEGSLAEEKIKPDVLYLQKNENVDPKKG